MLANVGRAMRTLKPGGRAKDWRGVQYQDCGQYMRELLEIEDRDREANSRA